MEPIAQLYQQILEVALSPQAQAGTSIAFVAGAQTGFAEMDGSHKIPALSSEFLPRDFDIHELPGREEFVMRMQEVLTEKHPRSAFLIAPYVPARHLSHDVRSTYPGAELQEIALLVAAENLAPGSMLGALLPRYSTSSERALPVRRQLYRNAKPRYVIDLGISHRAVFQSVHPVFEFQVLILETGSGKQPGVRFFRIPEVETQIQISRILSDFRRLVHQGGGETEYGYVLRHELGPEDKLLFDLHDPRLKRRVEDMRHLGQLVELGCITELLLSPKYAHTHDESPIGSGPKAIVPVLQARDIRRDGRIEAEERRDTVATSRSDLMLQPGDICVRQLYGAFDGLVAALVTPDMLPCAAGKSILVVRPLASTWINQDYLISYLRSKRAAEWLPAQGVGFRLTPATLAKLPVPVPDDELTTALASLREGEVAFRQWQLESQNAISSLFDFESARDARLHILSTGRIVKQRHVAGLQVQDLGYRVRSQFPHPIAYRWRIVEAARPDLDGYKKVLECAEVILCYLASLAMLSVRTVDGGKIGYLKTIADRLHKTGHGTNMGDWVTILREVRSSKGLRRTSDLVPFYEVHRFLDDGDVDEAVTRLSDLRNDQSHGRGPEEGREAAERFDEALRALRAFIDAVSFLSEYPLRYIEVTERDAFMKTTTLQYRDMMGDHPYVPIKSCEVATEDIEAKSLYAVEQGGKLHLFRPLLNRRECLECGSWHTFYLDRYRRSDDVCVLKSMERGHILDDPRASEAFRRVGLLPRIDSANVK